ncbi:MAG: twin transmembrane helix small protein [Methylococcaceae bacterium]|nr:twin transmembrane helix small protein [Methylococcaceae bacterium]MCI0668321.1 twin transmembrane helix small protein [Methylococcaceae bacterium]MCI0732707.1 twin transmembrane helix small protein [Methylococcaceae bacterium]
MILKIVIVLALLVIFASLVSALFYLVKDRDGSQRTARALTARITLSIVLFIFLLIAFSTGIIQPHGLNPARGTHAERNQ